MDLFNFELRTSDDSVKADLELTCIACGEHLCDAEPGDSIESLVATCRLHTDETGHGTL